MPGKLKEVKLQFPREPLQIPYPKGYQGEKSNHEGDQEFHLSCEPRYLTFDEVEVAKAFVKKLPYQQAIAETGAVLVGEDDPLMEYSHLDLDKLEKNAGLRPSRFVPGSGGCQRPIRDRVYYIREQGYYGSGQPALNGAAS